jgi:hypothetical protein
MARFISDLLGTLLSSVKIGPATINAGGLTAIRTFDLPDYGSRLAVVEDIPGGNINAVQEITTSAAQTINCSRVIIRAGGVGATLQLPPDYDVIRSFGIEILWDEGVHHGAVTVQPNTSQPGSQINGGTSVTVTAGVRSLIRRTSTGDDWTLFNLEIARRREIYRSGFYTQTGSALSTNAPALNTMVLIPLLIENRRAFDRIACDVTTAGGTGGLARLGIYQSDVNGMPSSLIVDAGTVANTTTGAKTVSISQTLGPGLYWLALVSQTATATYRSITQSQIPVPVSTLSNASGVGFQHSGAVSGVLPAAFVYGAGLTNCPRVALRFQ